MLIIVFNS